MGVTVGIPGQCLIVGSNIIFGWHGLESLTSEFVVDKIPRCQLMVYINVYYYLVSSIMIWMILW